ncbi:MAG: DUF2149 domain-containing protein [Motiliproteus sp.]
MKRSESNNPPPWQNGRFSDSDNDPLTGFANIMDVMLVFALGLMLALISQSQEMRQHFQIDGSRNVAEGRELVEAPKAIENMINGQANGMESLGQVYRDPESGKLILVGGQ